MAKIYSLSMKNTDKYPEDISPKGDIQPIF